MSYDIVVIDSGFGGARAEYGIDGINLSNDGNSDEDIQDYIGHGTEVVNLILKKNKSLKIFMVKVCNTYDGFDSSVLIKALTYILNNNINCKLLNISLGFVTSADYNNIFLLIEKLRAKGIVIISAFDNYGAISYPAACPNVIGVDCDESYIDNNSIIFVENSIVNIRCPNTYYRTKDQHNNDVLLKGASFATAYISSLIIDYLISNDFDDNYNESLLFLKSISKKIICFKNQSTIDNRKQYYDFITGVKKAIAFPFNKEIKVIANYESMLSFDIVDYFDYDLSYNKNKKINEIYPYIKNDKILHGYSNIDWSDDFDMIICGHCKEYSNVTHKKILEDIYTKCIKYNKKMYSFDGIDEHISDDKYRNYFFTPRINCIDYNVNYFGKLRMISSPVLGVFGTSSKQGKYTLQLGIKSLMEEKGYKVGGISTEPSGYLLGYDYVFPMGYGGTVNTKTYDSVRVINEIMWNIDNNNNDLIIVGSQSGTVPYDIVNMNNLLFNQYDFLIATHPDAVILCVNLFDTAEYINRTINFIESIGYSKVIAIVVFPVVDKNLLIQNNPSGKTILINQHIDLLKKYFNVPVFLNDPVNYNKIILILENYFA